jgi:hypothetical protein
MQKRDQLAAKLLQAEEQIDILQSRPMESRASKEHNSKQAPRQIIEPTPDPKSLPDITGDIGIGTPQEAGDMIENQADVHAAASADRDASNMEEHSSPIEAPAKDTPRPVVSLVMEQDDEAPQLPTLEEHILLQIFAFLDAIEIVHLAQVSIGMYSRVDSLFGISGEKTDSEPVPTETQTAVSHNPPQLLAPQPAQQPAQQLAQATIVQLPRLHQHRNQSLLSQKRNPPSGRSYFSLSNESFGRRQNKGN